MLTFSVYSLKPVERMLPRRAVPPRPDEDMRAHLGLSTVDGLGAGMDGVVGCGVSGCVRSQDVVDDALSEGAVDGTG